MSRSLCVAHQITGRRCVGHCQCPIDCVGKPDERPVKTVMPSSRGKDDKRWATRAYHDR